MGLWLRMLLAMLVVLTPGGFVLLVGYVGARTLRARWQLAQAQANGSNVSLRHVLATVHLKDLVHEARAAL